MKVAMPIEDGKLCSHFGRAPEFAVIEIDNGAVVNTQILLPPHHEPGAFPEWIHGLGVTHLICGGIGPMAIELMNSAGVKVLAGAPIMEPNKLIERFLANQITGAAGPTCPEHREKRDR